MDDLTRIDGIGKATARKLADAGIDTFAKLASIEDDGADGRAQQLGVKPGWIAEAARIVAQAATDVAEQRNTPESEDRGGGDGNPAVPSRERVPLFVTRQEVRLGAVTLAPGVPFPAGGVDPADLARLVALGAIGQVERAD